MSHQTKALAQHLQGFGRGDDHLLVHMTPHEVKGLQALAVAHGGSLTVNPETGLLEAGWLGQLLPVILGVGASLIPGVGPLLAAGVIGAGTTAITGNLQKGLMAGLGAFGGAALGGALGLGSVLGGGAAAASSAAPAASALTAGADAFPAAMLGSTGAGATAASAAPAAAASPASFLGKFAAAARIPGLPGMVGPGLAGLGIAGSLGGLAQPNLPKQPPDTTPQYGGPYIPTPRQVSFPNMADRLAAHDSSEYQYFKPSNPVPGFMPASQTMPGATPTIGTGTNNDNWMQAFFDYMQKRQQGQQIPGFAIGGDVNTHDLQTNQWPQDQLTQTSSPVNNTNTSQTSSPANKGGVNSSSPFGNSGQSFNFDMLRQLLNSVPARAPLQNRALRLQSQMQTLPQNSPQFQNEQRQLSIMERMQPRGGGLMLGQERGPAPAFTQGYQANPNPIQMPGLADGGTVKKKSREDRAQELANSGHFDPAFADQYSYVTPTGSLIPFDAAKFETGLMPSNRFVPPPSNEILFLELMKRGYKPFRPDPNKNVGQAKGGVNLRDGAFVVDARTVSELGNGSSNAGKELLARHGGKPIEGPGDGVSDSIHANVAGGQAARVARDEVKFDPEDVVRIGGGNPSKGAKKLYALMDQAHRARKTAKRGQDTGLKRGLGAL